MRRHFVPLHCCLLLLTALEGRLCADSSLQARIPESGCLRPRAHTCALIVIPSSLARPSPPELAPFYPAANSYLPKRTVSRTDGPVSMLDGTLITIGANSVGTLGGGVLGTAGMSFLWLQRRGVAIAAARLGGWLPIFLNDIALAAVSLVGYSCCFGCINSQAYSPLVLPWSS
jgi:hypothetical protein